jgi:large subunit ribosomal protein L6
MTLAGKIVNEVSIPEGVNVSVDGDVVTVVGKKGQLVRTFSHPRVKVDLGEDVVKVSCEMPRVKEKAMVGTYVSHLRNMMQGVTLGFEYKMKMVYSHFPMKVVVKGDEVVIDNFMGGRASKKAKIVGSTKVDIKGADLTISGNDLEDCGQTAANIEMATTVRGFDTRVFQDGIYIVDKAEKVVL